MTTPLPFKARPRRRVWVTLVSRVVLALIPLTGIDYLINGAIDWPRVLGGAAKERVANPASWGCDLPTTLRLVECDDPNGVAAQAPSTNAPQRFDLSGKVSKVWDGDTVDLWSEGRTIRIRLHGIDAPEGDQRFGVKARLKLLQLVLWRQVDIDIRDTDAYGRTVGVIHRGSINVNHELVRGGYAWWYRRYAPADSTLRKLEREARDSGRGLWRNETPVAPWEWRRGERS